MPPFVLALFCLAGLGLSGLRQRQLAKGRLHAEAEKSRNQIEAAYYKALAESAAEGTAVFDNANAMPRYLGAGELLHKLAMAGPDAERVAAARDALAKTGRAFQLSARTSQGSLTVRGMASADQAALFFSRRTEMASNPHESMDALPLALAVFDANRKLEYCNAAYAKLWGLAPGWLEACPSMNDILNQLREKRLLPEQRNFAEWKKRLIEAMPEAEQRLEQVWHLPSGKSLKLAIQPRTDGGVLHICEDISQQLKLESAFNLLAQVQRATLDTLEQGVAIFGTDGRLMLHNARFAGMWRFAEKELALEPHLSDIVAVTQTRIGHDGLWAIVERGVNSPTPECCGEWERVRRADGRVISLVLSRLPNGATLANFTDITDLEKFRLLQRETIEGLSATA